MIICFILFQFCAAIIVSEHNTSNDIWFIVLLITQEQIARGTDLESATLQTDWNWAAHFFKHDCSSGFMLSSPTDN